MIVADVNVLLYAVDEASPRHAAARTWLEGALSGMPAIWFPTPTWQRWRSSTEAPLRPVTATSGALPG
jgi:predicted nucleic acid-binding protein